MAAQTVSALDVPDGEAGRIRVFALSMTDSEAKALAANKSPVPETDGTRSYQEEVLGIDGANHDYIDIFPMKNLEGMGLVAYLEEGHAAENAARDKAKLGALGGWIMVVTSKAFDGVARRLDLDPRLTLIGIYRQEGVDWSPAPVTSDSALPSSTEEAEEPTAKKRERKPMSDARISGMVATGVLLFLAAFVTIFILLAG